MDTEAALTLARRLLNEHGLSHWNVTFDRAKRRAGSCRYKSSTITLSKHLVQLYTVDQVRETILHEIAHALVGPTHRHNATWQAKAREIGASGRRTIGEGAPTAPAPWVGTCPNGHRVQRFRRPSRPASCVRCSRTFSLKYIFTWTLNGEPTSPGPAYERALRKLHYGRN